MAARRPVPPGAVLLPLLALSACRLGAGVRLAPGREEPPALAATPGLRLDLDAGGAWQPPPAAAQLTQRASERLGDGVLLRARPDPWWVGNPRLHLVTVETRPNRTKVPGIRNIALNEHWGGYVTKLQIMTQWLDDFRGDRDHIIFVDGDDTLFGGCSQEQFLHDYREIVKSSGGIEVVIGAERGCYECPKPWTCQDMPSVPKWAYRNWTLAGPGPMIGTSRLDASGQMRFLNSGFITGPAGKLRKIFRSSLESMVAWKGRRQGDQYFVTTYFLSNPGSAVLDYASSLVTCGYSLNATKLFKLLPGGGLYNQVTHKHQCFFHANGPSFKTAFSIIDWQRGAGMPF